MSTATQSETLCSKCGIHPRANGKESTNPWCKDCLAKYQKEYKEMIAARLSATAFNAGVEALRKTLVAEFSRLGRVHFSGAEVAFSIIHTPRPTMILKESNQNA